MIHTGRLTKQRYQKGTIMRFLSLCRMALTFVICVAVVIPSKPFRPLHAQAIADRPNITSSTIELVGRLNGVALTPSTQLVVQGHSAYLADDTSFQIIDLSIPTAPAIVGRYDPAPGTSLSHLAVSGDYAYVGTLSSQIVSFPYRSVTLSLDVVNIHDPSHPFVQTSLQLYQADYVRGSLTISAIAADSTQVFLTISRRFNPFLPPEGSFLSIDITDPTAPHLLGNVDLGYACEVPSALAMSRTAAFITCGAIVPVPVSVPMVSLLAIDTADPQQPRLIASRWFGASGRTLAIVDQSAYVVLTTGALLVVDITNPEQLAVIDHPTDTAITTVTGNRNVLIITEANGALVVRDRATFTPVGNYPLATASMVKQLFDDMLVVAQGNDLLVLRYPSGSSFRGQVVDLLGHGVAGVRMRLNDGSEVVTDPNGNYLFLSRPDGPFTVTPSMSGASFVPPSYSGTAPHEEELPRFTQLAALSTSAALPDQQTQLHLADPTGFAVTVVVPRGALSKPAMLTLAPALDGPGAGGLATIGHSVDVRITPSFPLNTPFVITFQFTAAHIASISDTIHLQLLQRTDIGWRDATGSCIRPQPAVYDHLAQELQVPICTPGRFALVGPTHQALLPVVLRRR